MSEKYLIMVCNTPVAFFIFNRPNHTKQVFEAIRSAKPRRLLVIADGPRCERAGESEKCESTRAILEQVDWQCEVTTNFSNVNLGCKYRVSSGLDWVFNSVEEAIILEDDCMPHPSFFLYCEELLNYYKNDSRIMSITGQNVQFGRNITPYSYHFSRYFHCWGWASWRRAWQHYDLHMSTWPEIGDQVLNATFCSSRTKHYWQRILQGQYEEKHLAWDYSASFSFWSQNGLHIHPSQNLVSNLGFGVDATNTTSGTNIYSNMKTFEIAFPLKHPPSVFPNIKADTFTQNTHYNPEFRYRLKEKMKRMIKKYI